MVNIRENPSPYSIALILITVILIGFIGNQFLISNKQVINDNVTVGIVDSGCSKTQNSHVLEYQTFTNTSYGFEINDKEVYDGIGHGTQVCNLIIQQAQHVGLYSAKIANSFQITYQSILAAIQWLVEEKHVDIINLSLGSDAFITQKLSGVFEKYQNSTLFVVAAGNKGTTNYYSRGYVDWPSYYPWVIGVGANDPNNQSLLASYSASGIGYYGTYVDQFIANGGAGTSFSAPIITGKLANYLQTMRADGLTPTQSELLAVFIKANYHPFDENLGWGIPTQSDFSNTLVDQPFMYFYAPSEVDPLIRQSTELWNRTWKISSYQISSEMLNQYQILGNGSSMVKSVDFQLLPWGGYLTLSFIGGNQAGNYQVQFSNAYSNNFTYSFEVHNNTQGAILFDHRFSIDGYGHPYGEFLKFEQFLRQSNYIVNHAPFDAVSNLLHYNLTIVTGIGQMESLNSFVASANLDQNIVSQYTDYVSHGGKSIFLGNHAQFTNYSITDSIGHAFGVNQTSNEFGEYKNTDRGCCSVSVDNILHSGIGQGVLLFPYQGSEVDKLNNTLIEVAWISSKPIGIYGQFGMGYFLYFGGTSMISNIFFSTGTGTGFDRFITNMLALN